MGNVESGTCCGSYKVKQPQANMSRTQKKFQSIQYSHAKSTQVTQSNLSSLNQKNVPKELETKNSLTTVSSNNLSTPNHTQIRNSIGQNIKILVKVKQTPPSQIDAPDSNMTKRGGEGQSNFILKSKQCKLKDSPNKILMRSEDFTREIRNTDISGLYLPEVTVGPTSKFYESNINP